MLENIQTLRNVILSKKKLYVDQNIILVFSLNVFMTIFLIRITALFGIYSKKNFVIKKKLVSREISDKCIFRGALWDNSLL